MSDDERIGIHWPPGQRPKPGQKGLVYEITTEVDTDTKKGRIVWPDAATGHRIEPLDVNEEGDGDG